MSQVRIDKYLWAIRVFKTRSKAADACKKGRVQINDTEVKPAKDVSPGDEVLIRIKTMMKTIRVVKVIEQRVSATIAAECFEDLTPQEEYDKLKKMNELNSEWRDRGAGRPTKKERRQIEWLKKKR
ncbi:MAG TPA: RNA-binding S4 domain-containing protein [Bacteroidales bacterium]|nr:RNA-binding S4 domain-containing protein [Bacteroidales bacterium]